VSAPTLTGRERELATLRARLDPVPSGVRPLLLRGDPGIGKSALIGQGVQIARAAGCTILRTVGVEAEAEIPFAGLQQLVSPLLGRLDGHAERHRDALLAALGLIDGTRPELFLIAEAVAELLAAAGERQPCAVFVDDIQWLDDPSNDILNFIARRVARHHVIMIGAARAGHEGTFLAGAEVLELHGLDAEAADALLRAHAPGLTAAQRRRVQSEALGNPLALLELSSGGWSASTAPGAATPPTLSARLERAFMSRLTELPPVTRDALIIAAIDYRDDIEEIIAAAARLRGGRAGRDDLRPAERIGLLTVRHGRIRFRHPLVRSGILQSEPLGRQQAAHGALAEVLGSDPVRRVWHRGQSIIGPDDTVADELEHSAGIHLGRGALLTAISSLERSAQLTRGSSARGRRLLLAAQHAFALGRADLVKDLLSAARRTDLSDLDAARMQWLREIFNDGTPGDAVRVLELCDMARRCADAADVDLALDLLLGAAMRCWWADTGPRARARVVDVARGLALEPTSDARYAAILAVAEPVLEAATVSTLLDEIDEIDEIGGTGGTGAGGTDGIGKTGAGGTGAGGRDPRLLGMAAHAIGDSPRAAALLDEAEALLRDQGRLGLLAHVLSMQVIIRLELGNLAGAKAAVEEGLRLAEDTGQPIWTTGTLVCAARAAAMDGHPEQALELAARAELAANRRRLNDLLACVQVARGLAYLDTGDDPLAYAAFRSLFDPASPAFHQRERFDGVMFLAESAVRVGRAAEAREIVEGLETVATITPSPLLHAHLRYARAVLAVGDAAADAWARALAADLAAWPLVRARLRLAYGRWLRDQGQRAAAVEEVRAAHDVFVSTGATGWTRLAAEELRRVSQ
jgi:hypothetical protein